MSTTCRQRNARFWTYHKCGWVKLTLRPGQSLSVAYSGPAEEGYSREAEFWAYVGGQVWCYSIDEGRDCDGYWTHTSESVCPVDQLRARDMFGESRQWAGPAGDPDNWGIFAPQWQPVPKSQARDVFAEAMGY